MNLSDKQEESAIKMLLITLLFLSLTFCVTTLGCTGRLDDTTVGKRAIKKGDYDKAILYFTKAIDSGALSRKDLREIYKMRGFAWRQKGAYDMAIADCTKAIEIDPKYSSSLEIRGDAWFAKGDYDRAILDYTKAIEITPSYGDTYSNRGDILYCQGKFNEAIADYKRAIESNYRTKDYFYLKLLRTAGKVSKEDYQEYVKEFRVYVASSSKDHEFWPGVVSRYYLGMDQLTEEDVLAEARKWLIPSFCDKEERLCEAYYYLGEKRLLQGDRKGAEELLRKCIETNIHYFSEYRSAKAVLKMMGEGR